MSLFTRLFHAFIMAFALLWVTEPVRASAPVTSLPYTIDYNGWLTVKVTVNGQGPYDFIIDTGATNSLVFQNLADIQKFALSEEPPHTVLGLAAQGAFPTYDIGELRAGEAKLNELVSVILPDWTVERKPQGILGLDFLSQYTLVFNVNSGQLDLYDPEAGPKKETMRRWKRIPLKQQNFGIDVDHDLYTVEGRLNNYTKVQFMLDLGASGTVVNRAAVSVKNVSIDVHVSSTRLRNRITGALDQRLKQASAVRVNRLRVGRALWRRPIITIHDAPIFTELGVADKAFGLFGSDLVRDRSFMLDFLNGEMRVGPASRS